MKTVWMWASHRKQKINWRAKYIYIAFIRSCFSSIKIPWKIYLKKAFNPKLQGINCGSTLSSGKDSDLVKTLLLLPSCFWFEMYFFLVSCCLAKFAMLQTVSCFYLQENIVWNENNAKIKTYLFTLWQQNILKEQNN